MHLSIMVPKAQVVEVSALLRLVRMAPASDVEADEQGVSYVAHFNDFPNSVETAVQLIEKVWDLRDVGVRLDGRSIAHRAKFYFALRCYQGSLGEPDVGTYCIQQARAIGRTGVCPDRSCLSSCQFTYASCVGVSHDRNVSLRSTQLFAPLQQVEVDRCPNLRIPRSSDEP
ncbi:MAG: hypothetical protein U0223_07925 [Nitrospira sp.]|nr:hypothetical protein [Nitrospira sp.]